MDIFKKIRRYWMNELRYKFDLSFARMDGSIALSGWFFDEGFDFLIHGIDHFVLSIEFVYLEAYVVRHSHNGVAITPFKIGFSLEESFQGFSHTVFGVALNADFVLVTRSLPPQELEKAIKGISMFDLRKQHIEKSDMLAFPWRKG